MIEDDDAAKRREKLQALREKRKQIDAGGAGSAPSAGARQEGGGRARLLKVLAERRRQGQGEGGGENRRQLLEQFPKLRELLAQRSQTVEHETKPAADESSYRAQLEVRLGKLEATLDEILDYLEEMRSPQDTPAAVVPAGFTPTAPLIGRPYRKDTPAAATPAGAEVQDMMQEKSRGGL